ncbi:hypothetical protein ACX80W_00885 [Arthrobacter sp. TMN-37]
MLKWKRRLRTEMFRTWSRTKRYRWVILSTILAAVGVVSIFVRIHPALTIALALVSVLLVYLEFFNKKRDLNSTEFTPRSADSFSDVAHRIDSDPRFRIYKYPNGTLVHDVNFSDAIRRGDVRAHLADTEYSLPPEIRAVGELYREREVDRNKSLFDDPMLGWDTNIQGAPGNSLPALVTMTPGTYFQHIASDGLATVDVRQQRHPRTDLGRSLFIDKHGRLRDLGSSWLFNGIGTSVLAFSSDAKLLIVRQSARNANSPGLLAPSGSGSLEPKDFMGTSPIPLSQLAANGANRELFEEGSVAPHEVIQSSFLGFGRWLEKAARPELFTLSFLSVHSDELQRRGITSAEKSFVTGRETERLVGGPEVWDARKPETMLPSNVRGAVSVPLAAGLSLLADLARDSDSPFMEHFGGT